MLVAGLPILPAVLIALNAAAPTHSIAIDKKTNALVAQASAENAGETQVNNVIETSAIAALPTSAPRIAQEDPADPNEVADVAAGSFAFGDISDEAIVERVVAYIEGLSTMKGEFVQNAPSGAISTGEFWIRRPGQIRFEYDDPTPLMIVATQGNVYVQDKSIDQTDLYPIKQTPLRFLLSQNIDLSEVSVRAVERGADSVAVTFSAKNDDETDGDLSIVLSAPDLALKQWIIRDAQNGVTIVTLKNAESGVKLANSLFRAPQAGGAFINN